jgi:hypothetical protein
VRDADLRDSLRRQNRCSGQSLWLDESFHIVKYLINGIRIAIESLGSTRALT